MVGFGYTCGLLLAATLVWAGGAKTAQPAATRAAFGALGLPAAGLLARGMPVVEGVTAVLLLAVPRVGAAVALALLLLFSAVVVRAIGLGVTTGCSCFGSRSTEPVSWVDVVRNALLMVLALAALVPTRPVVPSAAAAFGAVAASGAGVAVIAATRRRVS